MRLRTLSPYFLIIALVACEKQQSNGQDYETGSISPAKVIAYFKEIAFGSEFGTSKKIIKKWTQDIKIFVDGEQNPALLRELNRILNELNQLVQSIQLYQVEQKSRANFIIFLGDSETYTQRYDPHSAHLIRKNWGFFTTHSQEGVITYATMYVNLPQVDSQEARKHLLREELTQALGLMQDSYKYPKSIFYQGWTETTEYQPIDRELIKLLYQPWVKPRMTAQQVEQEFWKRVSTKPTPANSDKQALFIHFKEIAFGKVQNINQARVIKKWHTPIYYYIEGQVNPQLQQEIQAITRELVEICQNHLTIAKTTLRQKANFFIYLMPMCQYAQKYEPRFLNLCATQPALFVVYNNDRHQLTHGSLCIDLAQAPQLTQQKYYLRKCFAQALGLLHQAYSQHKSIFYDNANNAKPTPQYTPLDKQALQLLYQPWLQPGTTPSEFEKIFLKNSDF